MSEERVFVPTMELRYVRRQAIPPDYIQQEDILQQKFVTERGEEEWRAVPVFVSATFSGNDYTNQIR